MFREASRSEVIATARHAADIGIRYFDAAPVYGYGNSERRLGAAVAHLPRDSYVLFDEGLDACSSPGTA